MGRGALPLLMMAQHLLDALQLLANPLMAFHNNLCESKKPGAQHSISGRQKKKHKKRSTVITQCSRFVSQQSGYFSVLPARP